MTVFEKYKNEWGSYDGAAMLSDISGLSKKEILWTCERLKQLMHGEGKTREEAKDIVKIEAQNKPWLNDGEKA